MGYQVYEDPANPWRWAGYGVPAECDWPGCGAEIDRGVAYRCEEHGRYELRLDGEPIEHSRFESEPDAEEVWISEEGCGLHFCAQHLCKTHHHEGITPKGESEEWIRHILTDESWEEWRNETPDKVNAYKDVLEGEQGMSRLKPCASCGHGKSKHRSYGCVHTWQTHGQTFMGISRVTKACTCREYKEKERKTDD